MSCQKSGTTEREFRTFLVTLSLEITDELLKTLQFLCKDDDLAEGKIDSTKTPREFLELLWKGGKIWPGDVGYLINHLETAGNKQLANRIKEIGECDYHVCKLIYELYEGLIYLTRYSVNNRVNNLQVKFVVIVRSL